MRWTVEEVARALVPLRAGSTNVETPLGLDPLARLAGVSIDSRTLVRGQLFVAISGPNHDGHRFVAAALEAGALGAVVERKRLADYAEPVRTKLFPVEDTLAALQELARAVRRKWGRRLAAVTGSVGKTTTKEILAALLGAKFRVLKSEGNLNNEYGLPLALLRLDPEHEAAVVELGMNHRGELRRLASIAEPEVGVVTRVAPVHLEFFASVDEIALAKRELIEGLTGSNPLAVLNADDERVAGFAQVIHERGSGRVLTFGLASGARFRAENIEDRGAEGTSFDFVGPLAGDATGHAVAAAGRRRLDLNLPGRHNVVNALAALAAASEWGIGASEAAQVFPKLVVGEMRGRLLRFAEGFAVINDCYNSNPVALAAMAELLARTPGYRRRVLVAGQMLELGPESPRLHRQAGEHAAALKLDAIFGVQGDASEIAAGATASGLPAGGARFFADSAEAAAFVAENVQPGDLLLIKGSRGVKMERIVESLKARHALAPESAEIAAGSPAQRGLH